MNLPEASQFEQPPGGAHTAICIAFIDLGTQTNDYQGETRHVHQVMLRWELCDEKMEDGQPFTVGQFYTWSMNEKAKLRQHLESWRNAPFTKDDLGPKGKFNTRNLLGKPCTLMVVLTEAGKSKVGGVGPKMKNAEIPAQHNRSLYLALTAEDFDHEALSKLSPKMQEMVMRAPEYRELLNSTRPKETFTADLDDEIPF